MLKIHKIYIKEWHLIVLIICPVIDITIDYAMNEKYVYCVYVNTIVITIHDCTVA